MKVRSSMFPGQVFSAALSTMPSQMSRDTEQVVLEIAAPAPLILTPESAHGVEIVEATASETQALKEAGFNLSAAGAPNVAPPDAARPWWKFWG